MVHQNFNNMNKLVFLIIGIAIGLIFSNVFNFFDSKNHEYYVLNSDYYGENKSVLKKGTKISYDQAFSEGFSRYILYINIKDSEVPEIEKREKNIYPFWFEKK